MAREYFPNAIVVQLSADLESCLGGDEKEGRELRERERLGQEGKEQAAQPHLFYSSGKPAQREEGGNQKAKADEQRVGVIQ